ncbi:DUF4037 domain-containing protein [Alloscardovia venturai]|uniref:DUF4037 domain-containing protein n=1 Tax=Alloscardovia venturai TaxID=1769421 RepID=A0ABW2Y1W6_9BIFI
MLKNFSPSLTRFFSENRATTDALPYLERALKDAKQANNEEAELTVICELLGFNRSHRRHAENHKLCERALALRDALRLDDTGQGTVVLIDVATAYRAAGDYENARTCYALAENEASHTLPNTDRRKASLYNNLSLLYSETGQLTQARTALLHALDLIRIASVNPDADIDVATTLTNIGLLELQIFSKKNPDKKALPSTFSETLSEALAHTKQAVAMYEKHEELRASSHYASALAGYAQVLFMNGRAQESLDYYDRALGIIKTKYGEESDYFETTQTNADIVRDFLKKSPVKGRTPHQASKQRLSGLELSRAYWNAYGDVLFGGSDGMKDLRSRAAIGLAGYGSECFGFDDEFSTDHDFGPRFCVWLTNEDFQQFGAELQERYDKLPSSFLGYDRSVRTPRNIRRDGVMSIDSFFMDTVALTAAPTAYGEEHVWLSLREELLATATNGQVFADPFGAFSSRRNAFKHMPEDVRLYLISEKLGMISQTGQYNFPRMMKRGDVSAARLAIAEFTNNVISLIFLLNNPASVGYAPYYKWKFAALRKLSRRMGTRLTDLTPLLEDNLGDPHKDKISRICARILEQLLTDGLTTSTEDFLEWQRPYIEEHITQEFRERIS